MELIHIRAVIAIAEYGSMTAAAEQLYTTSVSLMRQLNQVETELGFKIFERTRRGCLLTEHGETLYRGFKRITGELDSLVSACKQAAKAEKTKLTVCMYPPYDLMEILEDYRKVTPDVTVQYELWKSYDPEVRRQWMEKHKIDMLQTGCSPVLYGQGLQFCPVWEDEYCCFLSHDHPLAGKKFLTLEDLKDCDVCSFSDPSFVVDAIERCFVQSGQTLRRIPFSDSTLMGHCSRGGVFILEGKIRATHQHLICLPMQPSWPCLHGLAYCENAGESVLSFIEYLKDAIGRENVARMMDMFARRYRMD